MTYRRLTYDQTPTAGGVRVSCGRQTIELPHNSTPETWESLLATLGDEYEVMSFDGVITLGWPSECDALTVSRAPDLVSDSTPCDVRLE